MPCMVVYCIVYSVPVDTPAVTYGQLLRQEQEEEMAMSNQEETEGNSASQSSGPLEGGGDEVTDSLGPRLVSAPCTIWGG